MSRAAHLVAAASRRPLLRFLLAGTLLALARATLLGPADDPSRTIVIDAATVRRVAGGEAGGPPSRAALDATIDAWVDQEVLYREGLRRGLAWNPAAIARRVQVGRFLAGGEEASDAAAAADVARLGLDRDDAVVRAQVAGRMRLLLERSARRDEPAREELEAFLAAHRARFVRPARVTFVHVFVARGRGPGARAAAEALLRRIADEGIEPARAPRLGDAFAGGHRFVGWSAPEVERVLGAAVARAATSQSLRGWSAPVESPYGWHLVWVESARGEELPPLDVVRAQVHDAWRTERARATAAARLRALRAGYRVRIASVAGR